MPDIGKECRVRVTLPYRHADEINRRSEDDHRLRHDLIDDLLASLVDAIPLRPARSHRRRRCDEPARSCAPQPSRFGPARWVRALVTRQGRLIEPRSERRVGYHHLPKGSLEVQEIFKLGYLLVPKDLGPRALRRRREVLARPLARTVPPGSGLIRGRPKKRPATVARPVAPDVRSVGRHSAV